MATTTNYAWETPDDTDLVKDGAAAIRTLGSSIDTTTKALNPSTTLGDIEYRSSTANTNTRLGIGATGTTLTVVSGVPAWVARPTFNAYLSSNQTVTTNVVTKVQINTEEFDLGSCYDNATNYRFTPTTAGIYEVNITVQGNGSSGTTIWLYKNGSSIGELARTAGAGAPISGSRLVTMNGTTDYIEFFAQVAAGTIVYGGQGTTIFGAAFLRTN